jgi:hypothetical protein
MAGGATQVNCPQAPSLGCKQKPRDANKSRLDIGRLAVGCDVMRETSQGYFPLLSFDSSAMVALSS